MQTLLVVLLQLELHAMETEASTPVKRAAITSGKSSRPSRRAIRTPPIPGSTKRAESRSRRASHAAHPASCALRSEVGNTLLVARVRCTATGADQLRSRLMLRGAGYPRMRLDARSP